MQSTQVIPRREASLKLLSWKYASRLVLGALLCSQLMTAAAWATPVTPGDREEQAWRARQEAREKQERAERPDVFLQKEKRGGEDASLPEEETAFPIQRIILEGEDGPALRAAQRYVKRYEGKRIGMRGIQLIVKRATNLLIDRGLITSRVLLKAQDISGGELRLVYLPGKIHAIRFSGAGVRANWRTAFPTRPGDVLNLRDLEQGLEQLKRLQSREVDFQIVPAAESGESDVVITAKQGGRVRVTTSIDDSGSEATGRLQLSAEIAVDNLFNANDIFRAGKNHDGERAGGLRGTQGYSFYYGAPYGNWFYSAARNSYKYHQTVSAGLNDFVFSGSGEDVRFSAEKTFARSQTGKAQWDVGLTLRKSRSYVDDTEIAVQRRRTTAFALGVSQRRHIGRAMLDMRLAHKRGVPWFGAEKDPAAFAGLPTLRYRLWTFDLAYVRPVRLGAVEAEYRGTFSGQYTRDKLYAADAFSIGGRYTVRGFDGEQTLLGERGFYLQNELSVPLGARQRFFVGLDCGRVGGAAAEGSGGKDLLGAVAGFRGPLGKALQYEVFAGRALKKPDGMETAKTTLGFQLFCQM